MLATLLITAGVLIVVYKIITIMDYLIGLPAWWYRVLSYIAYSTGILFWGIAIIEKGKTENIIFILLIFYFLISALFDYMDYRYYDNNNEGDEQNRQTEQIDENNQDNEKKEEKEEE